MAEAAPQNKQVILQKIYLQDASLEVPQAPQIFTKPWTPQIDVQISTAAQTLTPEQHQVVLSVTVTAKLEGEVAFLAEVKQTGVFLVQGVDNVGERQAVLGAYCPHILFPFAREAVADLVQRGGFPQLLLQPVNFDALFQDHLNRAAAAPETSKPH
ncbi:MAG: protein-export chaperone SecB [Pseudomonadota bacterium]